MADYITLTTGNFEASVGSGVAVVDFWAPWCGPCRMIAPVIEELAAEYKGRVNVCKVNTDEETDLAVKFGIRSIPTILFFKDGKVVDQMIGAAPKQNFVAKLDALLA